MVRFEVCELKRKTQIKGPVDMRMDRSSGNLDSVLILIE